MIIAEDIDGEALAILTGGTVIDGASSADAIKGRIATSAFGRAIPGCCLRYSPSWFPLISLDPPWPSAPPFTASRRSPPCFGKIREPRAAI
jgi:hypothetical protein